MEFKTEKEMAERMGLTYRKDELMDLPEEERRAGYLKFNIPNPKTPYDFNGEGVWGWANPENKAKYNDDRYDGKLTVVLCNTPEYYGDVLFEGVEVVIQCNGDKRPILDPEWIREKLIDSGLYRMEESEKPEDEMRDICVLALETYGADAQTLMVFEEMSELQKELCKQARGIGDRMAIVEEIADVEITLEQMKILYNCAAMVEKFKIEKLERLKRSVLTEIATRNTAEGENKR